MHRRFLGIAIAAMLTGAPAAAQQATEKRPDSVARIYNVTAKEGHAVQLEQGMKKHMAWHRSAGDNGSWHVWTVETGPQMGSYLVGTFGRSWQGLEQTEMGEKDQADVQVNIAPHVANISNAIWLFRGDISPAPEGATPARFSQVLSFYLRPEGVPVFETLIRQISGAMMKLPEQDRAGSPPMLYQLVAGGEGPRVALVFSADSWGAMAPRGSTPLEALEKAFGAEKGPEIMKSGAQAIRYSVSEIIRYRPDLSSPAAASDN